MGRYIMEAISDIKQVIKNFKKKDIGGYEIDIGIEKTDSERLDGIGRQLNSVEKGVKKYTITQSILNDEIQNKQDSIQQLERLNKGLEKEKQDILKKGIYVLDQIHIMGIAIQETKNEKLIKNFKTMQKLIRSQYESIGLEEVARVEEIFNPSSQECIDVIESEGRQQHEIVNVVKQGYRYDGRILRVAQVTATK